MGSWSVYCGISKIAITAGDKCVLLPIKENVRGISYLPYLPATLPIFGSYDDYGGIEDIEETPNTKLIEEHFGISISDFAQFLVDGEFTYQREEAKEVEEKMKNYAEASKWRFMWIKREVYDFMSSYSSDGYDGKGYLEFGNPSILKLIGFNYIGETENSPVPHDPKRWKHEWEFQGKKFFADRTWIYGEKNGKYEAIYSFSGGYSNNLSDFIEIPENKMWIGEKTMWQLWAYLDSKKQKEKLGWIIGKRYDSFEEWDLQEELRKLLPNKLKKELRVFKTLEDNYFNNIAVFGNELSELVSIRSNMHPMSGSFEPYIQYLTPQTGEFREHQVILDKFAQINREKANKYDE